MNETVANILGLEEAQAKAFNEGRVADILDFFHPDFVGFSSTKHDRITGLQALRETFEYYLHSADKIEYHISDPAVHLYGDMAIVTFYWVVALHSKANVQEIKGRGSHVYVQQNDAWKIVHEHFSRAHHHV